MEYRRRPRIVLLDLNRLPPAGGEDWYRHQGLTFEEIDRAGEFRDYGARLHYLGARLLIRQSVAEACGCAPTRLGFRTGITGKPEAITPANAAGWHFNAAHSGDLAACIVARHPVGIDLEPCDRIIDPVPVARRHFTPAEADWIAANHGRSRQRFLALWTLKEAYLKGMGTGLATDLASVTFQPVGGRQFRCHDTGPTVGNWHCRLYCLRSAFWLSYATPEIPRTAQFSWWRDAPLETGRVKP
jgi:4'-phosphopantetheinyl transferase